MASVNETPAGASTTTAFDGLLLITYLSISLCEIRLIYYCAKKTDPMNIPKNTKPNTTIPFNLHLQYIHTRAMFASLIIRHFQLIFSTGIAFFSRNESVGTVFFFYEANGASAIIKTNTMAREARRTGAELAPDF